MGTRGLARSHCPSHSVVLIGGINPIVAESDPALRLVIKLVVADLEAQGFKEMPEARFGDQTRFEVDHGEFVQELDGLWPRLNDWNLEFGQFLNLHQSLVFQRAQAVSDLAEHDSVRVVVHLEVAYLASLPSLDGFNRTP